MGKAVVSLSQKGQVTIPKNVRDALGLRPSDRVMFDVQDGVAVMRPVGNFLDRFGSVKPRNRPEDFKKMREEVSRQIGREIALEGR